MTPSRWRRQYGPPRWSLSFTANEYDVLRGVLDEIRAFRRATGSIFPSVFGRLSGAIFLR
jgi:hypothetical protein